MKSMAGIETRPFGPAVKATIQDKEVIRYPYQEQKDLLGPKKYDAVLVLGEGPVKKILFSDQLTADQQQEWKAYKVDKLGTIEPEFYVIDTTPKGKGANGRDRNPYAQVLMDVDAMDIPEEQKDALKKVKRAQWQETSPKVKRQWGRANALAGGMLLYLGKTNKLILTGGYTGESGTSSEAEMMQDVIIRRFGRLMFECDTGINVDKANKAQYTQYVEEVLKPMMVLENKADNTIGNVVFSANTQPEDFMPEASLALITSGHHLNRSEGLIGRVTGKQNVDVLSAQQILEDEGRIREFSSPVLAMQTFQLGDQYDSNAEQPDRRNKLGEINPDLESKVKGEEKWSSYLTNPDKLLYWIGYVGMLEDPRMVRNILQYLLADSERKSAAETIFQRIGFTFDGYAAMVERADIFPKVFELMQIQLTKLTAKEIRQETF